MSPCLAAGSGQAWESHYTSSAFLTVSSVRFPNKWSFLKTRIKAIMLSSLLCSGDSFPQRCRYWKLYSCHVRSTDRLSGESFFTGKWHLCHVVQREINEKTSQGSADEADDSFQLHRHASFLACVRGEMAKVRRRLKAERRNRALGLPCCSGSAFSHPTFSLPALPRQLLPPGPQYINWEVRCAWGEFLHAQQVFLAASSKKGNRRKMIRFSPSLKQLNISS